MQISERDLKRVLNPKYGEEYWYSELGRLTDQYIPKESIKAARNYPQIGRGKWKKVEINLRNLLCNKRKPKKEFQSIIEGGDERDLVQAILSAILLEYSTSIAIAIPLIAIVMRKSLLDFCSAIKEESIEKSKIQRALKVTKHK